MVLVEVVVKLWWKKDDSCHEVDVDRYVNETTWKPYGLSLDPEQRIEGGVSGNRRAECGERCLCEASCAWQQRFWPCNALALGHWIFRVWVSVHSLCSGEDYMLHYKCIFITSSQIIYSAYSLCTGEHWHASCERQCTCSSRLWEIQNQTVWENFEYIHICTITSPQETQTWKPSHHIKYKYLLTSNTNTSSHQIQIPSHNDAVFVASDTLPFVADCVSEILTWSASIL